MSLTDFNQLPAESAAAVAAYLDAVREALSDAAPALAGETVEDVTTHLLEALEPGDGINVVRAVLAELGDPADYAEAVDASAAIDETPAAIDARTKRVLGLPYEFRVPTAERVASRWWDPSNPHVFVPRVFGIGWDLNFGALAVRFGWIEPDAEDEPFASTPESAFMACLMLPVALFAFVVISYAVTVASLPTRLPVHWNLAGHADNWASAEWAFMPLALFAGLSTLWAAYSTVRDRPRLLRGAVTGFAAFLSGISAAVWALTLFTVAGVESVWLPPALILTSAFVAPLLVLTVLARTGRRAEIERDLRGARQQ
ncbi:MAG TPA: DUF5808 domain-containing protein [Coriobacteriia bacterium]|nr:DUF5808 domain-containing protein [Coriobacteriia bacterium]